MTRRILTSLLSASAIVLLTLPVAAQDDVPAVNGRILLPEGLSLQGAVAWTVLVEDASVADAPATIIGADGGAVGDPSSTEVAYAARFDPEAIEASSTYTLSVRIIDAAGDPLFVNDGVIPVITNGAPVDGVDVPVIAAGPTPAGEARVIDIEATAVLTFAQDGEKVTQIPLTPGETVVFRIDNTAGFPHNFYIGADEDLKVPGGTTEVGVPDWDSGVQELEWVVPDDLSGVRFACTVPGHYTLMQGDFTVTP